MFRGEVRGVVCWGELAGTTLGGLWNAGGLSWILLRGDDRGEICETGKENCGVFVGEHLGELSGDFLILLGGLSRLRSLSEIGEALQFCGEPLDTCSAPLKICGELLDFCGDPLKICGDPLKFWGEPLDFCDDPLDFCGDPLEICCDPLKICGAPLEICGEPCTILGEPCCGDRGGLIRVNRSIGFTSSDTLRFKYCGRVADTLALTGRISGRG